jgi:hypothetical protein
MIDFNTRQNLEQVAKSVLARMGMKLLSSGKKPGSQEPGYRIICGDRLTIHEVLDFVTEGAFLPRTKTRTDLLAMATESRSGGAGADASYRAHGKKGGHR